MKCDDEFQEVPFEEKRIELQTVMRCTIGDGDNFKSFIVEVTKIPISMCTAHDQSKLQELPDQDPLSQLPVVDCKMRIFDRLPGNVEVKMLSADDGQTYYCRDYMLTVPMCHLNKHNTALTRALVRNRLCCVGAHLSPQA